MRTRKKAIEFYMNVINLLMWPQNAAALVLPRKRCFFYGFNVGTGPKWYYNHMAVYNLPFLPIHNNDSGHQMYNDLNYL